MPENFFGDPKPDRFTNRPDLADQACAFGVGYQNN